MAHSLKLASLNQPISNGALKGKELPRRIKVLNWGTNTSQKGSVIVDHDSVLVFDSNQRKSGRERAPIDWDHNTVKGTEAYQALEGRPPVIFGYGTPRIVPNEGVYFEDVEWTPHGEQMARDYIDLSPTVALDERGKLLAIASCALTPAGAVHDLQFYSAFDSFEAFAAEMSPHPDSGDEYDCMRSFDSDDHYSKYGDVEYADEANHKYPVDTEKHVRAAWSYINMPKNSAKYSGDKLSAIKRKIRGAAKRHGIQISEAHNAGEIMTPLSTAAASSTPDAYRGARKLVDDQGLSKTGPMNKEHFDYFRSALKLDASMPDDEVSKRVLKHMAAKLTGKDDGEENDAAVKHLAAAFGHVKSNPDPNNPPHMNQFPSEGGPVYQKMAADLSKAFEDKIVTLSAEIKTLRETQTHQVAETEQKHKDAIIAQANKDGKVFPFKPETVRTLSVAQVEECIAGLSKPSIPTARRTIALNATPTKKTMADAARAIEDQIANSSPPRPLTLTS